MLKAVIEDVDLLLDLLNTTPVVDGLPTDALEDRRDAARWLGERDLPRSPATAASARRVRDAIALVVRGEEPARTLEPFLEGVSRIPSVGDDGVRWELNIGSAEPFSLRCVLTWAHLQKTLPGRLRPCANDDCRLFLIDHSRANTRRWCSMAACGNRLKARRHHRRATNRDDTRAATTDDKEGDSPP
ncbi:CGNR zinc finger domain-containing protein [Streptosporangium sp. NPDC050280]|uniref:CGNR zinc finger domain-containing protein n=1 Tax=unclassified Streptosporangium TaxID=2632669 RepID=UPI0034425574